jgi:branched-subunit amino acid transport protein
MSIASLIMEIPGKSLSAIDKTVIKYVGFEVFTAVVMKSIIFWDVTPCSLSCNSTDYMASHPR